MQFNGKEYQSTSYATCLRDLTAVNLCVIPNAVLVA